MDPSIPVIKSRKRRVVAEGKRKKALFSCDRCKMRKIACKRPNGRLEECLACQKSSSSCSTTIKRKKKTNLPIENLGLHYKCLLFLVRGMLPQIDANNIDALIEYGNSINVMMPSRDGTMSEKETEELMSLSSLLTSSKIVKKPKLELIRDDEEESPFQLESLDNFSFRQSPTNDFHNYVEADKFITHSGNKEKKLHLKPFILPEIDLNERPFQCEISLKYDLLSPGIFDSSVASDFKELTKKHPLIQQPDSIIVDHGGNVHYIGPFGAPGFLQYAVSLIALSGGLRLVSNYQKLYKSEIVISSSNEPLSGPDLKNLQNTEFPVVNYLDKAETDHYVDIFYEKVHKRYFCFVESDFRDSYQLFWKCLNKEARWEKKFSSDKICCFYLVWILGRMYEIENKSEAFKLNETLIKKYIQIIKLCLSDILLTPTLDGIRCCILLSIYMDNNKKREIAYLLLEYASGQAISLGINRESVMTCTTDAMKVESMKRTWWTLFSLEINYSIQMGRSSCVHIEDITIDYPSLGTDSDFQIVYSYSSELSKYSYSILEYRKKLLLDRDLLSASNMESATSLIKSFEEWYSSLPEDLSDLRTGINDSKLYLNLRFFYYTLSFTFPFLIYASKNTEPYFQNSSYWRFIEKSIYSCIKIGELLGISNENGLFNGSLFPDLFIGYHAIMGLIIGYTVLKGNEKLLNSNIIAVTLKDMKNSIASIRKVNDENKHSILGSSKKISRFIDIFCNGFDILEQQDCGYENPDMSYVEEDKIVNFGDAHFQISKLMESIPILESSALDIKNSPMPLDEEYSVFNIFPY